MGSIRMSAKLGVLVAVAVVLLAAVVWLPRLFYPSPTAGELRGVPDAGRRIELRQAQDQAENDFRGQLLQGLAGVVVIFSAAAGWQQLRLAREGQVADRFTKAIEHLGSSTCNIRLGGIYALERLARTYPVYRTDVTYLLNAFVRDRVPWAVGTVNGPEHPTAEVDRQLPWLSSRAADVQTAMWVLGRRTVDLLEQPLYLSRMDLRRGPAAEATAGGGALPAHNPARCWPRAAQ